MTSHGNDFFIWVLQLFILYLVFAIREGGIDNVKTYNSKIRKNYRGITSGFKIFFSAEGPDSKVSKTRIALALFYAICSLILFPILDINNINAFISMAIIYAIGFIFIFISSRITKVN